MQTRPTRILGINPGARYIGVALFHGAELHDWRIKVVKGEWSKKKLSKIKDIVGGLIEQFQPDVLAIKKLHPSRSSRELDRLIDELKIMAETRQLQTYEFPIKYVEAFLSPAKKINKWKLAALMAEKYSALFSEWEKERTGRNNYYMRMFEAVMVAYVCFRQLDRGAGNLVAELREPR